MNNPAYWWEVTRAVAIFAQAIWWFLLREILQEQANRDQVVWDACINPGKE